MVFRFRGWRWRKKIRLQCESGLGWKDSTSQNFGARGILRCDIKSWNKKFEIFLSCSHFSWIVRNRSVGYLLAQGVGRQIFFKSHESWTCRRALRSSRSEEGMPEKVKNSNESQKMIEVWWMRTSLYFQDLLIRAWHFTNSNTNTN